MEMKDKFDLVGTKIQDFSLPNSRGETIGMKDLVGKNIVLVLFRNLSWPYCRWHATQLRRDYDKYQELDAYIYTILADNEGNAKKMEQKYARKYPVFYDESKEVVKMLHQEVKALKLGRMPGLLIIDKQGIIRYAYYSDNMHDIPENEVLLDVLRNIN